MASALLTAVLLGITLQAVCMYYGYLVPGHGAFARHFTMALASTFLIALAHSMTMFFFIGKSKLFPIMMAAIAFTMAQFILGGGVHTRVLPAWLHHILGWLAFGSNVYCFLLETKYLVSNARLMSSVYRAVDR